MATETERELLSLLARTKELHTDLTQGRPAVPAADSAWDDALASLDDAISALGLGVYQAVEFYADQDAIEAGDAERLPSGDVMPVQEDPRR